jgi:hypothetical protein
MVKNKDTWGVVHKLGMKDIPGRSYIYVVGPDI